MKKMLISSIVIFAIFVSGCTSNHEGTPDQTADESVPVVNQTPHIVKMLNTKGKEIGTAALTETAEGVKIHLQAKGLKPGEKAIHIHETGKCEAPDFTSAGEHFNPEAKQHGFQNPQGFHAGDLPNIKVSKDGTVNVVITAPNVSLETGKKQSLFDEDGSALVIHEHADDYKTDPAGNAGKRIACGVIHEQME